MISARSTTMVDLRSSFSVLVIGLGLCVAPHAQAQNPPMNCTPDGIIEVCTAPDSAAPVATDPVPAPAAKVTYKGGLLTISAENVSLSDVLHEVSAKTGATIDFPQGSATEPVFTNIGPGPVRDILATLLNGTKFNYVMLGSENSSSTLEKIVLTQGDQPTEVAESSAPVQTRQFQRTQATIGSEQTPEERRAQFMQEVENMKATRMAEFEQKYAKMAADGLLRTPAPPPDSGSSPAANAPAESPAADSPAPDSPNQ